MTTLLVQLDLSKTAMIITIVKDIFLSMAAILTGIVAIVGLTAWKKELKGKSEYQLAKEVLMAVYKVREGFKNVRGVVMYSHEYPESVLTPAGQIIEGKEYETYTYAYNNRWEVLREALQDLENKNLEAQVEWGPENHDKIRNIRSCASQLQYQIWNYLEHFKNPEQSKWRRENMDQEQLTKEKKKQMEVLYNQDPDSVFGGFTSQINEALEPFEKWLRPKIK